MSTFGGMFRATAEAMSEITAGQLRIVGSTVRYATGPLKGKIRSYLQETGLVGGILQSLQGAGSTLVKGNLNTGVR